MYIKLHVHTSHPDKSHRVKVRKSQQKANPATNYSQKKDPDLKDRISTLESNVRACNVRVLNPPIARILMKVVQTVKLKKALQCLVTKLDLLGDEEGEENQFTLLDKSVVEVITNYISTAPSLQSFLLLFSGLSFFLSLWRCSRLSSLTVYVKVCRRHVKSARPTREMTIVYKYLALVFLRRIKYLNPYQQ